MKRTSSVIFCLFVAMAFVHAQKLTIGYIYPAGGERGTTVDIEIGGLNLTNTTGVVVSGSGVNAELITTNKTADQPKKRRGKNQGKLDDQSSPQLADRIQVRVTIDKHAAPGLRDLRLESPVGVSNKLMFEVGQYSNQLEQAKSSVSQPNRIEKLPVTLCGQILPGEVDYYSFEATKGMMLVAEVKARTLVPYIADAVPGWFQSVIRITDSQGKEIAYSDDYHNSVDPVIVATIPRTDTYTLAIHDAIYRGREDFNYRINLGEIPHLDFAYPCVGRVGKKTKVTLKGVNLKSNTATFKPTKAGLEELTANGTNNNISNPIPFLNIEKGTELIFTTSKKVELTSETALFDSLTTSYQIKTYPLFIDKNENIAIEVKARRIGSLLDAKMTLRDANGKVLLISDDVEDPTQGLMTHHADPVIKYKATEAGYYTVEVEDVLGNFGKDYFYLIERKRSIPSYEVFVSPANLSIQKGSTAILRLDISSSEKFVPPLDITIKGLPKGFLFSNLQSQAGNKVWEISITAPENAKEEELSLDIETQAQLKGKNQESTMQSAVAADNMMQAFYYTHHIIAAGLVAEVIPASPFSLHLSKEIESHLSKPISISPSDTVIPMVVRIRGGETFTEPIELNLNRKIKHITMDAVTVQPGETEKTVYLKIDQNMLSKMRRARFSFNIIGTVKGVVEKKGQRNFQNAKYKEQTPMFLLEKEE
ncbi:MAG: hypothetical protein ACOYOT_06225 [Bacteroidales bacterium]